MEQNTNKDPAFLFYSSDFLSGTMLLSNEQLGKYIRLLCLQHQKGHLLEKDMLKICLTYDEDIFSKFIKDEEGFYFNERLENEICKRKNFCESRRNNRLGKKKEDMKNTRKTYVKHMENENENINKDLNINNIRSYEDLFKYWESKKSGKKYKDNESRERMLNRLKKLTNDDFEYAKETILFCIDNNYQGFSDGNKLYYNRPKSQPQEVDMEEYFRSL